MFYSVLTLIFCTPLLAANHALVMWIGAYPDDAKLPGIHLDAAMAKKLAKAMGVPNQNIIEVSNSQLSSSGFAIALNNFQQRIKPGDQVFIYYSGHGAQMNSNTGAKCSEGMVGIDLTPFPDTKIEQYLKLIGNKAKQVVMFNDSCFSGGQVSKSLDASNSTDDFEMKPKLLKSELLIEDKANPASYQCGDSINSRVSKALDSSSQVYGSNFLYIAASSEKEVSFATSLGSAATLAWSSCLNPKSDTDRSGQISGEELQDCAQNFLNGKNQYGKKFNQHVSLIGNTKLPLVFTSESTTTATTPSNTSSQNTSSNAVVASTNTPVTNVNTSISSNLPNTNSPITNTASPRTNSSNTASTTIASNRNNQGLTPVVPIVPNLPVLPSTPRNNTATVVNSPNNQALQNRVSTQTTQVTQSSSQELSPVTARPNIPANVLPTAAPGLPSRPIAQANTPTNLRPSANSLNNSLDSNEPIARVQTTHAPATFADLHAMSNSKIKIKLEVLKNKLKIGQDYLEMKLQHEREAYIYLFYTSAENSSIDVLFPNPRSPNNKLKAGSYLFPSPDWALRSAGPAGDGAIIALSSSVPLDFASNKGSDSFETTVLGVKQFFDLIGAKADSVIGASSVVKVTEYD